MKKKNGGRSKCLKSKYLLYLSLEKYKSSFNLEKTICNHGFFMMAPNKWVSSIKSLQRPLRLIDQRISVTVTISHPPGESNLHICVHGVKVLSPEDQQIILDQVSRMLRISNEDEKAVNEFQEVYPAAKEEGFGRIFRSPSVFEDVVKSLLLCHCSWGRSLKMAKSLCDIQLQLSSSRKGMKRGKGTQSNLENERIGNFPNSKELLQFGRRNLEEHCNLGMRARYIIKLAEKVENGTLSLEELEKECDVYSYESVHRKLSKLKGFGPFATATILMCMGCYQKVPADSETKRHLKQVYGMSSCKIDKDVEEIYSKYAPFQCIVYWFEVIQNYEKKHGKLCEIDESKYHTITGNYF